MTQTLVAETQLDTVVKKSLFRVHAAPIANEEEALAFFERVRELDATHNCWAWRIGGRYRSFDDGEPGGTAGRPILQAIDSQEFDHVAVMVVRWFGGVKLGAGGLVRAYGGAAAACLKQGEAVEIVPMQRLEFHASFSLLPIIQARLTEWDATQDGCEFDATGATVTLCIPLSRSEPIQGFLQDLLRGGAIRVLDDDEEDETDVTD
ncbi:IMPACT family protein [Asaia astilbis]|uniref:IMPACT family protein n=1 Tax=Asaia astilbis TaxID=610244 RepID=UPI0004703D78|nr:YigZ family protein [Asaia astilbis]